MRKNNWIVLLMFIALTELTGWLSSLLSGDTRALYQELIKPPFSPPAQLFGIVWPILYALMGIAAYLIYSSKSRDRGNALFWFFVQLTLNFFWSIFFFRFQLYWTSVVILLLLDILVAYTIYLFGKIDRRAQILMIPYLLWLIFATYLNIGIALLN